MAIAPDSASYPILGAAQAAGIDYGLALAWADARGADRHLSRERIKAAHGGRAFIEFFELMDDAHHAGRIELRRWRP